VLRWRQWWSEYSGDAMFSSSYQQKYNLQPQVAAPGGEGKRMGEPAPQNTSNPSPANTPKVDESPAPATGREPIGPQPPGGEAPAANGQPQQPNRR